MGAKKGQNRRYQKEAFQHGLTQYGRAAALSRASAWFSGSSQSKKDRLNVCRKKSKGKRK